MERVSDHVFSQDRASILSAKKRAIRHFLDDGWSVRQICRHLECSPSLVRRLRAESLPQPR
jgi:DNA-binding NarL/FixJ family response regulator